MLFPNSPLHVFSSLYYIAFKLSEIVRDLSVNEETKFWVYSIDDTFFFRNFEH